jgi:hypothetical protein
MTEFKKLPRDFYYDLKVFLDKWIEDKPTNQYLQKYYYKFFRISRIFRATTYLFNPTKTTKGVKNEQKCRKSTKNRN